jgi:hypothetical protein
LFNDMYKHYISNIHDKNKLDYLTHTSLSPIRHGFTHDFVNYKKGCTRLAAASVGWMIGGMYGYDLILILLCLMPLSAISRRPVLVVEEAGVPEENHRP